MARLPDVPDVQEEAGFPEYVGDLRRHPRALAIFRQIFLAPLAPNLAARKAMSLTGLRSEPIGARGGRAFALSGAMEEGSDLDDCAFIRCLAIDWGGRRLLILQDEESLFKYILEAYAAVRNADPECLRLPEIDYPGDCAGDAVHWNAIDPAVPEPSQRYWVYPFDGVAISWEPIRRGDAGRLAELAYARKLAVREAPIDCDDFHKEETGQVVPSACGVFVSTTVRGEPRLLYCRQTIFPGFSPEYDRCVPLFRQRAGAWQVAQVAGKLLDEIWGGDVMAMGCSFETSRPLADQSGAFAGAFAPLFGGPLSIRSVSATKALIGGEKVNIDLSSINRARPWAFLKIGISLKHQAGQGDTDMQVTASFTVAARRMTSRTDGRETTEEESWNIKQRLNATIADALRRIRASGSACESSL